MEFFGYCGFGCGTGEIRPTLTDIILRAVANETFHTNPKRKRGNDLATSLTLRVSVVFARSQYILFAGENKTFARGH